MYTSHKADYRSLIPEGFPDMTNSRLISEKFSAYKSQANELLKRLQDLTIELKAAEFQKTVSNLRSNINDPLLFVVIGEVKSGKSSFVNALLGAEVCKVAPEPMTDTIQQIVYGEKEHKEILSNDSVRLFYPVNLLKDIAIVDTPGTNTVIEKHHEITKEYIPNSDLVFFVFPAKNPHTKSSWDLLSFVADEWKKNVVFVLQQKDLATEEELKVNREKVKEYALNQGMRDPIVFSTSAVYENEGKDGSGFESVRQYIRKNIAGGQNLKLKLRSILITTNNIIDKIDSELADRRKVYESDLKLVNSLKQRIESSEKQSRYEIERLADRITGQYERVSRDLLHEFERGLTLFSLFKRGFKSIFSKEESMEGWLNNLQHTFRDNLHDSIVKIAEDGSEHFINGIRSLTDSLIDKMNSTDTKRYDGTDLFSVTIKRRENLINQVKENLLKLRNDDKLTALIQKSSNIQTGLAGGSALTVVGAIILFSTHLAFFDITGGVLTAAGLIISSGYTVLKRKKIISEFERNISSSKSNFREELLSNMISHLEIIYEEIQRYFVDYFSHVEKEAEAQEQFEEAMHLIKNEYRELKTRADTL